MKTPTPHRPHDQRALDELRLAVRSTYGERLVSCAVFGSVARATATPESDLDVLIVAEPLPRGRMARAEEFAAVERILGKTWPELSPVIKSKAEVERGSPLFWDMTEEVILLDDRNGFLAGYLDGLRRRLGELGAHRVWKGSAWYWVLKRDFVPGEVFEL